MSPTNPEASLTGFDHNKQSSFNQDISINLYWQGYYV